MKKESNVKADIKAKTIAIIKEAIKGKQEKKIFAKYKRGIDYYKGKHKITGNTERQGNKVWNKFGEIVGNRISNIVDVRPKWNFKPEDEEGDVFLASALNQIIGDVIWDDVEWEDRGEDALMEAAFGGSCHVKTSYRKEDGFPVFEVIPNAMCFPDPSATNARNRRYFVQAVLKSAIDVKDETGIDVSPDNELERANRTADGNDVELSFEQDSATSYKFDSRVWKDGYNRTTPDNGMVVVWEVWSEDKTRETIPFDEDEVVVEHDTMNNGIMVNVKPGENHEKHVVRHTAYLETLNPEEDVETIRLLQLHIRGHNNYQPFQKTRRKYPNGRVVTYCQGKVLKDRPNPLPIPWRDVILKFDWWKIPTEYWGKPLTNDLFDPQDILNHRKNAITKNINQQNKGVVLLARSVFKSLFGGSNKKKLSPAIEGQAIPVDSPNDFRRDNGPALQAHVVNDPMITEQFMERNSGDEGVLAGRLPGSGTAGVTVDQLLGQAQKPLNTVIGHYSFMLKKMAINAIAVLNEFVDDRTKFRIIGNENKIQMIDWGALKERAGLFDIRVDITGQLATSRERRFNRAIKLREIGVYDNQAVLEQDDDPMKFEIMQRTSEILQLKQVNGMLLDELDKKDKEINTMMNRTQTNEGKGNVGGKNTTD